MTAYELAGLRDEAAGIGAQLGRWEAWTRRLEAMQVTAEGAWLEHATRLQALTNEMIDVKMRVAARGTVDIGGYPHRGPTGEERLQYELLEARKAAEEARWQRWVGEQQIADRDPRGDPYTWSPRRPSDVGREQGIARQQMAALTVRLQEIERQIAELEDREARPVPAPADAGRSGLARLLGI